METTTKSHSHTTRREWEISEHSDLKDVSNKSLPFSFRDPIEHKMEIVLEPEVMANTKETRPFKHSRTDAQIRTESEAACTGPAQSVQDGIL